MLLTARECEREPALAGVLHRAMDATSVTAAIAYTFVPLKEGRACAAVARQQAGESIGFSIALWLTALVYLSESRTAGRGNRLQNARDRAHEALRDALAPYRGPS